MEKITHAADVEQTGALPRVMRELIRTPAFRELIKLGLQEQPPGSASLLARTILWEDVDITLSLLGASPQLVNFLTEFLVETGRQFQNFPAEVLRIFIRQMGERVVKENLQALPGALSPVIDTLIWNDPAAVQSLLNGLTATANVSLRGASSILGRLEATPSAAGKKTELDAEAVAELINSGARSLGKAVASRPGFLRDVVSHIDRKAVRKASDGAFNAFLDARIPILSICSWAVGAVFRRIKGKLKG